MNDKFDGMGKDTELIYVYDDTHKIFYKDFVNKINCKLVEISSSEINHDIFDL